MTEKLLLVLGDSFTQLSESILYFNLGFYLNLHIWCIPRFSVHQFLSHLLILNLQFLELVGIVIDLLIGIIDVLLLNLNAVLQVLIFVIQLCNRICLSPYFKIELNILLFKSLVLCLKPGQFLKHFLQGNILLQIWFWWTAFSDSSHTSQFQFQLLIQGVDL